MSARQQADTGGVLRMGDVLQEPLYRRRSGAGEPVLLLAAGHRIQSELQLRQLRAEGYAVALPGESGRAGKPSLSTPAAGPVEAGAEPEAEGDAAGEELAASFSQRLEVAARVRQMVTEATRGLMGRVQAGAKLEIESLEQASSSLLTEVGSDAGAVVTLTFLQSCDDYTVEHSADVAILMVAIARLLELPAAELPAVALAGLMHDVGKQLLPAQVLQKPGGLTREEFEIIRRHPHYGFELLAACEGCPEAVRRVALEHHEREDGSGYPAQLTGEQLHRYSRIAAVADAFDAMTSDRVYRRGRPAREALMELYRERERRLDAEAVEALIRLVGVYPVGSRVRLNTGERGMVVAPNPQDTVRPVVRIDRDPRGRVVIPPRTLAMDGKALRIAAPDETA